MHLNHIAWTSVWVGLTDFNSFSQTVKATIKKLVVPLYTSR